MTKKHNHYRISGGGFETGPFSIRKVAIFDMKKTGTFLIAVFLFTLPSEAQNQWVDLSKNLNEPKIHALVVHPLNPQIIFAGSERHIFRSDNGGENWKQVMAIRGDGKLVQSIYVDPSDPKNIYVCSERGVDRSADGGVHWTPFFTGPAGHKTKAYFVMNTIRHPDTIWLGTDKGLFQMDIRAQKTKKVGGLPDVPVYSINLKEGDGRFVIVIATQSGIYKSEDAGEHWQRVLTQTGPELTEAKEAPTLEQFDIEELVTGSSISNVIFVPGHNQFYAGTKEGIFKGSPDGAEWKALDGQNLPGREINAVANTSRTFYAATDRGLFQWDEKAHSFHEIDEGLPSKEIKTISYSPAGDFILVGTAKGIYRLSYPELEILPAHSREIPLSNPQVILERFNDEPAISEIQNAAVEYAEVHPRKIQEWRAAASRKALLPTLSLGGHVSEDQNVDIDRGGTNDPDRFIFGPDEENRFWSVGLSWDLGNLIWNDDQTSIDTRSKLMVELRDDILNEVTHLYFERRRLQVEMALAGTRDLPVQIQRQLRLEELTANIDALTGGYLSKWLRTIPKVQPSS